MTGEGTSGGDTEEEGNAFDGLSNNLDIDKVDQEFEKYKAEVSALIGDGDVKSNASSMMRAMAVLVRESKMDASSGKLFSKFENINVLVGP